MDTFEAFLARKAADPQLKALLALDAELKGGVPADGTKGGLQVFAYLGSPAHVAAYENGKAIRARINELWRNDRA